MNLHFYMDSCFTIIVSMITVSIILAIGIPLTSARQCYVCGIGPTDPLYSTMMLANTATDAQQATSSSNSAGAALHQSPERSDNKTKDINDSLTAGAHSTLGCSPFVNVADDVNALLVECPSGYKGCFSQTDATGHTTIRTCNRYSIDDCKTANRVTYCYCNTDRCNGQRPASVPAPQLTTDSSNTSTTTGRPQPKLQHPIFRNSDYNDDEDNGDDPNEDDDDAFEASGNSDLDAIDDIHHRTVDHSTVSAATTDDDFDLLLGNATSSDSTTTTAIPIIHNHNHRHRGNGSISTNSSSSKNGCPRPRWTTICLIVHIALLIIPYMPGAVEHSTFAR